MNLLLLLLMVIIIGGVLLILYKLWDKNGLYIFIVIATILSLLLSLKIIKINNFNSIIYFPTYSAIFMCVYLFIDKYNKSDLKKIIYLIISSYVITFTTFLLNFLYYPTISNEVASSFKKIFLDNIFNIIAYPFLLIGSVVGSIYLYKIVKKYYDNIFITSCFTTIVIQFIDTIIFSCIVLFNKTNIYTIINIALITYVLKLVCNIAYIPLFCYSLKYRRNKDE